jgi:hypothetical protein
LTRVQAWLDEVSRRDPAEAARVAGDALAATNRVAMSDSRRMELAEAYWNTATQLWPQLERSFIRASHPLSGPPLEAAKAALTLAHELSVAYKHLLASEADKRISLGGTRLMTALVQRCLQCFARILTPATFPIRRCRRARGTTRTSSMRSRATVTCISIRSPAASPTRRRTRSTFRRLLLALANPYGFHPGQLNVVLRYLQEHAHWAKLTDVAPVHRMAKAVAIVPVGHDFPPFSANKGGSIDGSKLFLLTYDLAFQLQEQLRALDAGGAPPDGIGKESTQRLAYVMLLKRLLRQWAIPPARQFNRLPSRARVVMCAGLSGVWQYSRGQHAGIANPPTGLPPMTSCQVINHTPAGYALRQTDHSPAALRIGELIALRVEGRLALQVAMVRWFRNTLKGSALEFGCELLSDNPEAAAAAAEDARETALTPVVVIPEDTNGGTEASPPQLIVPAGTFSLEQAVTLKRGADTGFAVLTKLVEQGPGFELFEFVAVG